MAKSAPRRARHAAATAAAAKNCTPLIGAEAEIFKLIFAGATPDQWAEWLRVPLEHAAAAGNPHLFARLVEAGANCGAGWSGCGGRTLLDAAALGGNVDVISAVLQKGSRSDVNVLARSSKRSALYTAVVGGHEAAARKLIMAGADVNYVDPVDGYPALVLAVRSGSATMVTDLLLAGASPCDCNDGDNYPSSVSLLQVAAAEGHQEIVSAMLSTTANINAADRYGNTALMLAARRGHLSTATTLLAAGVDVGIRTIDGETALHVAVSAGQVSIMEAILKHGADVNARDSRNWTALHYASVLKQHPGTVDVLLRAGANINAKDDSGCSPLHFAAERGCCEAALALLRRGAQLDESENHGNTALHLACRSLLSNLADTVDLLLRWGASEVAVNNAGQTPLQLLDACLDGLKTSPNEWNRHLAEGIEPVSVPARLLLVRAPTDRVWRRRCLLVMLRARNEKETVSSSLCGRGGKVSPETGDRSDQTVAKRGGSHEAGSTDENMGAFARGGGKERKGAPVEDGDVASMAAVSETSGGTVGAVVEHMPDVVFRNIVLYL